MSEIRFQCKRCGESIVAPSLEDVERLVGLYSMVAAVVVKTVCPMCEAKRATEYPVRDKIEL